MVAPSGDHQLALPLLRWRRSAGGDRCQPPPLLLLEQHSLHVESRHRTSLHLNLLVDRRRQSRPQVLQAERDDVEQEAQPEEDGNDRQSQQEVTSGGSVDAVLAAEETNADDHGSCIIAHASSRVTSIDHLLS